MSDYAVLNGEVVNTKIGTKARGNFKLKYGKSRISIYKVTKKGEKFVGYATKMKPKTLARAEKLQQIRIKKAQNKKIKLDELNRKREEELKIWRERLEKEQIKLESESISAIEDARRSGALFDIDKNSGQIAPLNFSKEQQGFYNFNRILGKFREHNALDMNKVNDTLMHFYELDLNEFENSKYKFEDVESFINWLYVSYRDGDKEIRNEMWDLLHSLESESGFTYNPLE